MNISIIGTGYVGLVTGACFAEFGVNVICADKIKEKIELLKKGEVPFYEPGLREIVEKNLKDGRLSFTTDVGRAVRDSLVIFIAVGTPSKDDGSADLTHIDEVAESIGKNINGYKVVVTKSTVPVGTSDRIKRVIEENMVEKHPFSMASNPEFLREGSAVDDFMRPDRVVIGANSEEAIAILKDLYRPLYLIETPIIITDIKTAELIKYASNAFLATKISFINEVANLCEHIGADVHVVAKAMGLDGRIGPKFLHPGPGFGGSCFPKDTSALASFSRELGYTFELVETVIRVNEKQRWRMVSKVERALGGSVKGKKIGVLGLSFKPNTNDIRESPAIFITKTLKEMGASITAYDPAAMDEAKRVIPDIAYAKSAYEVAEGADCVVLITEWNQFRNLDLERLRSLMKEPVFVDLRNVYEPDIMERFGFKYFCVGRKKEV